LLIVGLIFVLIWLLHGQKRVLYHDIEVQSYVDGVIFDELSPSTQARSMTTSHSGQPPPSPLPPLRPCIACARAYFAGARACFACVSRVFCMCMRVWLVCARVVHVFRVCFTCFSCARVYLAYLRSCLHVFCVLFVCFECVRACLACVRKCSMWFACFRCARMVARMFCMCAHVFLFVHARVFCMYVRMCLHLLTRAHSFAGS
jgi:hypothetical protein